MPEKSCIFCGTPEGMRHLASCETQEQRGMAEMAEPRADQSYSTELLKNMLRSHADTYDKRANDARLLAETLPGFIPYGAFRLLRERINMMGSL